MQPDKIVLISGGTGFIGKFLSEYLKSKGIFTVVTIGRWNQEAERKILWCFQQSESREIYAVIHLAGANVFAKRWTESYKKILWDSRIKTVYDIHGFLDKNNIEFRMLIGASAIGYYGNEHTLADENSSSGSDFLSRLCVDWEKSYRDVCKGMVPFSILRLGVVLHPSGGPLKKMLGPFGVGSIFLPDGGNFPFNWVALQDLVRVIEMLLREELEHDIYNVVSPAEDTYRSFIIRYKKNHNLPSLILSVPKLLTEIVLGERIHALVSNTKIIPQKLVDRNFTFTTNL